MRIIEPVPVEIFLGGRKCEDDKENRESWLRVRARDIGRSRNLRFSADYGDVFT